MQEHTYAPLCARVRVCARAYVRVLCAGVLCYQRLDIVKVVSRVGVQESQHGRQVHGSLVHIHEAAIIVGTETQLRLCKNSKE